MTEKEKAEIVGKASPMYVLVNRLGLKYADVKTRKKQLAKYKAFSYKNYDGGFRTATVYEYQNEYFCSLYNPKTGS